MKLIKYFLLLFTASLVIGCGSETENPDENTEEQEIIIPGVGTDKISLGETGQAAVDIYGTIEDSYTSVNGTFYHYLFYLSDGLSFYLDPNDSETLDLTMGIDRIELRSPYQGKTAEGIGINSTKTEVIAAYGEPSRSSEFFGDEYEEQQMTFVYDEDETVLNIELE